MRRSSSSSSSRRSSKRNKKKQSQIHFAIQKQTQVRPAESLGEEGSGDAVYVGWGYSQGVEEGRREEKKIGVEKGYAWLKGRILFVEKYCVWEEKFRGSGWR